MTAKEKALELVNKFMPLFGYWDYYNDTLRDKEYVLNDAKHHALICIEEQIELLTKIDPPRDFRNSSFSMELMKLKQLKQEIEKL